MIDFATPQLRYSSVRRQAKLAALEQNYVLPQLGGSLYEFSILSGHNCPWARECYAQVETRDDGTRTVRDGAQTRFRCFSASQEALYPSLYARRAENSAVVALAARSPLRAAEALADALPDDAAAVRIHVGGDFRTLAYFDAWRVLAVMRPGVRFYAYTKALPLWVKRKDAIPRNLVLTASYGGTHDRLIRQHRLRYAQVVYSAAEARQLRLAIDHDDSHAIQRGRSFALLIHGVQPKGSAAAAATAELRRQLGQRGGAVGYGRGS